MPRPDEVRNWEGVDAFVLKLLHPDNRQDPFYEKAARPVYHRRCGGSMACKFDFILTCYFYRCQGCDQQWIENMPWTATSAYLREEFCIAPVGWGHDVVRVYFDTQLGCHVTRPATPEEVEHYFGRKP